MDINWQQNFRRTPDYISSKLETIDSDEVVVACVKKITESDIQEGMYEHIGIIYVNGSVQFDKSIFPLAEVGKFSNMNRHGLEVVRKDLPKYQKITHYMESPNWGDRSKGTHEVPCKRYVYPREYIAPKELEILVDSIREEDTQNQKFYHVRFLVDEVLDTTDDSFEDELFHNLNLLMENVGAVDVFPSDTEIADYIRTTLIQWEILPAGQRDTREIVLRRFNQPNDNNTDSNISNRIDVLLSLSPEEIIIGTSGFRRYLGARFSHDLVVFENPRYGNAIYIMFENWVTLSQLTRIELMNGTLSGFERIIHSDGWENKLRTTIRKKLAERTT